MRKMRFNQIENGLIMKTYKSKVSVAVLSACLGMASLSANALPFIQCPGDTTIPDPANPGSTIAGRDAVPDPGSVGFDPNVKCMHLSAGDGFTVMADRTESYLFSFADMTGIPEGDVMADGALAAAFPAPAIELEEGQEFYLTLTNVGMIIRPDLADPHTVHFHGFPNASAIFDGLPDASISINEGNSLTYYYKLVEPGTYMYHCHVEATEHMQMGMLGNLYIHAGQDKCDQPGSPYTCPAGHTAGDRYAYNDGDGSTQYDVEKAIQIGAFDGDFHDLHEAVQPIPFAEMRSTYPMLNGRGYPDTVQASIPSPTKNGGIPSQVEDALVEAEVGQKILLRISNLQIIDFYTLKTLGLDMKVVGMGARELRGADGTVHHYTTNSITLGGGEAIDVIIDTAGVAPGTYFLYTSNLNYLSNRDEDFGGMMTEIRISAATP